MTRPLVAVGYDHGAAGPAEIAAAGRSCAADVLFVIDRASEHVAQVAPVLRRRFDVCDITGRTRAQAVAAVAARHPDAVVTFSELCLPATAALAAGCGLAHWHTPQVTEALTDKATQRRLLAQGGVDTTRHAEVASCGEVPGAVAIAGLPAVMKPRHGTGGRDVRRVDDLDEAVAAARHFFTDRQGGDTLLVEELISGDPGVAGRAWGDYVSVEALLQHGHYQPLCVVGKLPLAEPFREQGFFLPATLGEQATDRVLRAAEAAVRVLGVRHGIVHTELKLTSAGPRVLEVNGRAGGHVPDLLRRGAGFDLVAAGLRLALGRAPAVPKLVFDGVTYQYVLLPPVGAHEVLSVGGTAELRALDGVDLVDLRVAARRRADWRDGAFGAVGKVYGHVPDHRALAALADLIEQKFRATASYSHPFGRSPRYA